MNSGTGEMTTIQDLPAILASHAMWVRCEEVGNRADLRHADLRAAELLGIDLRGADLRDADLRDADLRGANLHGADLRGADLSGAKLRGADLRNAELRGAKGITDDTPIALGNVMLGQFKGDVVPALLAATGKTVAEIVGAGCWECHSWDNCPMHAVFGVKSTADVPPLWRAHAATFVQLFDAGLLPVPEVP